MLVARVAFDGVRLSDEGINMGSLGNKRDSDWTI